MSYKRHWSYLKYILKHKWYVFVASRQTGCSLWRGIVHDLSKFRPSEWSPYAMTFYDENGKSRYLENKRFSEAWLHHQHRNPHHWQYWILKPDNGSDIILPIPMKYVREMIADWMGAGRVITGEWEVYDWYHKNKHKMVLNSYTREDIENIIDSVKYYGK